MPDTPSLIVMAGPAVGQSAIHVLRRKQKDVDGRDKHGHDGWRGQLESRICDSQYQERKALQSSQLRCARAWCSDAQMGDTKARSARSARRRECA